LKATRARSTAFLSFKSRRYTFIVIMMPSSSKATCRVLYRLAIVPWIRPVLVAGFCSRRTRAAISGPV